MKGKKLAPFNPTSHDCIGLALGMMTLTLQDRLYDLGCGDGRFLVEVSVSTPALKQLTNDLYYSKACRQVPGIQTVGVEYDKVLLFLNLWGGLLVTV